MCQKSTKLHLVQPVQCNFSLLNLQGLIKKVKIWDAVSFTLLLFDEADVHLLPCPLSPSSTCCWILMSVTRVLTILRCDLVWGEDEGGRGTFPLTAWGREWGCPSASVNLSTSTWQAGGCLSSSLARSCCLPEKTSELINTKSCKYTHRLKKERKVKKYMLNYW